MKNQDLARNKKIENNTFCHVCKGQLISKCPFGVFKSTKTQRNFYKDICPSIKKEVKSKK